MEDFEKLSDEERRIALNLLDGIESGFSQCDMLSTFSLEFSEKIGRPFALDYEFFYDFLEALELRCCENCGKIESVYNGGGHNSNGEEMCAECLEDFDEMKYYYNSKG